MAWYPVLVVAAVAAAAHLVVASRYGWHRDELYYVICGRHLAWGYVDHPPLTPLLARLATAWGGGVSPLRVLAVAVQAGCVVLAAVLAAEFGGRRRAQVIAAAGVAACPAFVGASLLFGTTVVDQLVWMALFVLVARALRLRTMGAWLVCGVTAGVGMENKATVVALLLGIAVGLVAFHRQVLRKPGPWLAGVVAVALATPNMLWNAAHQWPNLQMARVLAGREGGPLGSFAQLPLLAVLLAGPLLVALWVMGVRWLISAPGREHRWVLTVAVVAVGVFTMTGGKPYYAAPALAALFAAGAVRVEATETARGRVGWPILLTASFVTAVVAGLPVLPVGGANTLRHVNPELMETYGWPQFVDQVAQVAATLPPNTPIFTSNYGEAGALKILGPSAGLHESVFSGHNNYGLWGPPPDRAEIVLCVGQWDIEYLQRFWSQVDKIAPLRLSGDLRNQEITRHAAIYICRQPKGDWGHLWPGLRHLG